MSDYEDRVREQKDYERRRDREEWTRIETAHQAQMDRLQLDGERYAGMLEPVTELAAQAETGPAAGSLEQLRYEAVIAALAGGVDPSYCRAMAAYLQALDLNEPDAQARVDEALASAQGAGLSDLSHYLLLLSCALFRRSVQP